MNVFKSFFAQHPRLASWAVLATGMVILFLWSARDQSFSTSQWIGLSVVCILLAGACAWIIHWE